MVDAAVVTGVLDDSTIVAVVVVWYLVLVVGVTVFAVVLDSAADVDAFVVVTVVNVVPPVPQPFSLEPSAQHWRSKLSQ